MIFLSSLSSGSCSAFPFYRSLDRFLSLSHGNININVCEFISHIFYEWNNKQVKLDVKACFIEPDNLFGMSRLLEIDFSTMQNSLESFQKALPVIPPPKFELSISMTRSPHLSDTYKLANCKHELFFSCSFISTPIHADNTYRASFCALNLQTCSLCHCCLVFDKLSIAEGSKSLHARAPHISIRFLSPNSRY